MAIETRRAAILALHWQVNVIRRDGYFGGMLGEPVERSGVIARAVRFHEDATRAGVPLYFTRFTIPEDEGGLVRNTAFMRAVADAQESFRPDAPGARIIDEMHHLVEADNVVDNQKLSGLAGNDLAERLRGDGVTTLFITGVATNLTVEQTARHATDLGFHVHPVTDCVTAATEDAHKASLANLDLTTAGCLSAAECLAALTGERRP
ncbi:cysteine hydrolase [Actinoallomurus spadix]|uniref:Isochorismatase-like domain-containing protein n=1 Tax=Actinoallomurus spadix TaxID=79912 RepID=A0ABP3HNA6_9ACTN|nr:cysteine hydrolase [Actinoallomurus spadix]MCO5990439.1 cysteine hydrolase [Actinoallomurus spadix]